AHEAVVFFTDSIQALIQVVKHVKVSMIPQRQGPQTHPVCGDSQMREALRDAAIAAGCEATVKVPRDAASIEIAAGFRIEHTVRTKTWRCQFEVILIIIAA